MTKRSMTVGAIVLCVVIAAAVAAVGMSKRSKSPDTAGGKPEVTLTVNRANVAVGQAVRLTGVLSGVGATKDTTVALQRKKGARWVTVGREDSRRDGSYAFVRIFDEPARGVFRTVALRQGTSLDASSPQRVAVKASRPSGTPLPVDLGAKKLTDCAASEQPCFSIDDQEGRRVLRFPMVTVNVGPGPLEIHGYRSSRSSNDWIAALTTHYTGGGTRSRSLPHMVFYYAEDGHNHWHIRDFDYYQVLDSSGKVVRRGEKHGFCFEDNTTFRDWSQHPAEHPGVPQRPVYAHESSCGEERPYTTSIVHGLSMGWADTYPTSLPNQNIDITGLADGIYTVRVEVDGQHLVPETDETNNNATVRVQIQGRRVLVDASTATGF